MASHATRAEHSENGRGAVAFVCGLLHESDWPTLLGSPIQPRPRFRTSSGYQKARDLDKVAENDDLGLLAGAKDAYGTPPTSSVVTGSHAYLLHVFGPTRPANTLMRQMRRKRRPGGMFSSNHNYFLLPTRDRPNGKWLFSRQPEFLRLCRSRGIRLHAARFHLLLTDFDFQHLPRRSREPKYGVVSGARVPE